MRKSRMWFLMAVAAALLLSPASSWGITVIDDFDDDDYSDDGLLFDTRAVAWDPDPGTTVSIGGGSLGVMDFTVTAQRSGSVTLTYSTDSDGLDMTGTEGFELKGVFDASTRPPDPTHVQMLTWTWTAKNDGGIERAAHTGDWSSTDDRLKMDLPAMGFYTDWKTLEFDFSWILAPGDGLNISASTLVAIPEPGALPLFGLGLLGVAVATRRRSLR